MRPSLGRCQCRAFRVALIPSKCHRFDGDEDAVYVCVFGRISGWSIVHDKSIVDARYLDSFSHNNKLTRATEQARIGGVETPYVRRAACGKGSGPACASRPTVSLQLNANGCACHSHSGERRNTTLLSGRV